VELNNLYIKETSCNISILHKILALSITKLETSLIITCIQKMVSNGLQFQASRYSHEVYIKFHHQFSSQYVNQVANGSFQLLSLKEAS